MVFVDDVVFELRRQLQFPSRLIEPDGRVGLSAAAAAAAAPPPATRAKLCSKASQTVFFVFFLFPDIKRTQKIYDQCESERLSSI